MKKLLKITKIAMMSKSSCFPNYKRYGSRLLIAQIGNMNKYRVEISRAHLLYFPRNKQSNIVMVGLGWVGSCRIGPIHRLNDSDSLQTVIKIYFNFFQFFESF